MKPDDLAPVELEEYGKPDCYSNSKMVIFLFFFYFISFMILFIFLLFPDTVLISDSIIVDKFPKNKNYSKKSFAIGNIPPETTYFEVQMNYCAKNRSDIINIKFNMTYTMISRVNGYEIFQKGENIVNQTLAFLFSENEEKCTKNIQIYKNDAFLGTDVNFTLVLYANFEKIDHYELLIYHNSKLFYSLNETMTIFLVTMISLTLLYIVLKSTSIHSSEEFQKYGKLILGLILGLFTFYPIDQRKETKLLGLIRLILELYLQFISLYDLNCIRKQILVFLPLVATFAFIFPGNIFLNFPSLLKLFFAIFLCFSTFSYKFYQKSKTLNWFLFGLFTSLSIFIADFIFPLISKQIYQISRKLLFTFIDSSIVLFIVLNTYSEQDINELDT